MKLLFVVVALAALTAFVGGTKIRDLFVEMSSASVCICIDIARYNFLRWANVCEKPIVMRNRKSNLTNQITLFQKVDNSTDDLEIRVTLLEDDVTDLQDEVDELETDVNQLDDEVLFVQGNVAENSNDIDGKLFRSPFRTLHNLLYFIHYV